jgi:hypothetical protein
LLAHPCWTSKPLLADDQKAEIARYRHYGRRAKPPQSPQAWSHIAPPLTPSSFFSAHDVNALDRWQSAKQATFLKKLAHKISYGGGDKIPADFWVRPRAVAPAKQADAAALFRHRPISQTVLATAAETPLRDVNQCAAALQVSPRAVRQMISSGELKGTRRLVRHQDLLARIEARENARPTPPWPDFSAVEHVAFDPDADNQSDAHCAFDDLVAARTGHIPALGDDATNNRAKASAVLFDLAETVGYSTHKIGAYSRASALSDDPAEGVSRHVARRAAKQLRADGYASTAAWIRAHSQRIRKPRSPESRGDIEAHIDAARDALKNRPAAFKVWLADFRSKARHVRQREAYEAGRYRKALAALKADPTAFKAWCASFEKLKHPANTRIASNNDALIVGLDAIAQALGRSKVSVIRSVANRRLPVAELHGEPVLLKALVPHLRDRAKTDCSRAKSKKPRNDAAFFYPADSRDITANQGIPPPRPEEANAKWKSI